jgi:hypothetical protein
MIIGKKEQERLEREQCAQISLLCRQKLMGYAESFEELGKSFRQEIQITAFRLSPVSADSPSPSVARIHRPAASFVCSSR